MTHRQSEPNRQQIPERHVVLVAPEVHWNTGNIGRTCLGAGAVLHLVKPLGFSLNEKQVKRAGLDYWSKVSLHLWDHFDQLVNALQVTDPEVLLLTKSGGQRHWLMPSPKRLFLVFGSETQGLPDDLLHRYRERTFRIPIHADIRCLNLSTSVGIVLYESLRLWVDHLSI